MRSKILLWLAVWLATLEALTLSTINIFAYAIRDRSFDLPEKYVAAGFFLYALYLICGITRGSYAFQRTGAERIHALRSVQCWLGAMVIFVIALYVFKISDEFSRFWLFEMVVGGSLSLALVRTAVFAWMVKARREGRFAARVAVFGSPKAVGEMTDILLGGEGQARFVGGYVSDGFESPMVQGVPRYGAQEELHKVIAAGKVDEILFCFEPDESDAVSAALASFREQPVNIRLRLPSYLRGVPVLRVERVAGQASLVLAELPIGGWASVQKRCMDLLLGSVLVLVLAPVMLLTAATIRIAMGRPVLFRQKRYGFNNDEFWMLKFRSMVNAPAEDAQAGVEPLRQATRDDPRVTRLGRLLRRTSLDELPQLLNVLDGSMSLVGPRPHAVWHNKFYAGVIDGYLGRHRVKPGITGWAQVNGLRGETDTVEKMRQRVELDLFYIENWSLGFDLKILALTIIEVCTGRSAY